MKREPVSDTGLAQLGKFQGLIERNNNPRQSAINHNLGRNVRVFNLLAYIGLMRAAGKELKGMIDCTVAIKQHFSSSNSSTQMGLPTGPMQAAHFLPGQIRINCRPIWEYIDDLGISAQIEVLFAEVEHLPIEYNQADSAAEAKGQPIGLCAALVQACKTMVSLSPSGIKDGRSWRTPWNALQTAYNQWHMSAINGLRSAIESKLNQETLPPLIGNRFNGYTQESIKARSTAEASIWNREFAIQILKYYLEDQQQRGWAQISIGCHSSLQDIEQKFRP